MRRSHYFSERKKCSGVEGLEVGSEVDLPVLQAQLGPDIIPVGDDCIRREVKHVGNFLDDARLGIRFLYKSNKVQAGLLRHHDVTKEQIDGGLPEQASGLARVSSKQKGIAFSLQDPFQQDSDGFFIINNQDGVHFNP